MSTGFIHVGELSSDQREKMAFTWLVPRAKEYLFEEVDALASW